MAAMGNVTEPMMSGFSGTSNPRLPVAGFGSVRRGAGSL